MMWRGAPVTPDWASLIADPLHRAAGPATGAIGAHSRDGHHSGSFRSALSSVFKILPVDPLGRMSRISTRRGYL